MREKNEGKCLKSWKNGFQSSLQSNLYSLLNGLWFLPLSPSPQSQGVLNLNLPSQRSAVLHTRRGTSSGAAVWKRARKGPPFWFSRIGLWAPTAQRFCYLPECGCWENKPWVANSVLAFSFAVSWRGISWSQAALCLNVLRQAGSSLHAIEVQAACGGCRYVS